MTFADHESAQRAFYALNNLKLLDKKLKVNWDKIEEESYVINLLLKFILKIKTFIKV